MKIAVLIDVDTDRPKEKGHTIMQEVVNIENDTINVTDNFDPEDVMVALCEGIVLLIHTLEKQGKIPSYKSLQNCIRHLEQGFADESYEVLKVF